MENGDRVKTSDGMGTVEKVEGHTILIKLDSGVWAKRGVDQVTLIDDSPSEKSEDKPETKEDKPKSKKNKSE